VSPAQLRRVTASEAETVDLGGALAAGVGPGDLLAIQGELGAGKTCLVRGIAAGLGCDPGVVRSPTYVLHHVYRGGRLLFHHLDLYRLGPGADLGVLDLDGLLETGAAAVEWADLADLGHLDPVRIRLEVVDVHRRAVLLDSAAPERLASAFVSFETET
jgi:tRNA threonylcarbamoyladenosine biosynthesis protein TsaE